MEDSMAHPPLGAGVDLPSWKSAVAVSCAVLLALLFIAAGAWKLTDPFGAAARLAQAKVPGSLSVPAAIALGIGELFSAVLLLIPRYRRWGSWLTGLMLMAFMVYIGVFYNDLRGEDCSCFPWLKRSVGPMFFVTDGLMLVMAAVAGRWARPSNGLRSAAMVLGSIAVFAGISYGVAWTQNSGTKAPDLITVEGKQQSLAVGRFLIFFFDPECMHCDEAARRMAKWKWKDVRIIGVATRQPQFAVEFVQSTGLKAGVSADLQLLKETFPFGDPPYGVAIENGRQKAAFSIFDEAEPEAGLRQLGYIE